MLRPFVCLFTLQAATALVAAPTFLSDTVRLVEDNGPLGDIQLTVFQELPNDERRYPYHTNAWFDYKYATDTSVGEIESRNRDNYTGSDWYLVREGDQFSAERIQANEFVRLFELGGNYVVSAFVDPTYWPNIPFPYPESPAYPVSNFSSEFYLAFATNERFANGLTRDIFGWVHLRNVPPVSGIGRASLEMVSSATVFDSGGIVIGTLQAVPEPHAGALALLAALPAGLRRRR